MPSCPSALFQFPRRSCWRPVVNLFLVLCVRTPTAVRLHLLSTCCVRLFRRFLSALSLLPVRICSLQIVCSRTFSQSFRGVFLLSSRFVVSMLHAKMVLLPQRCVSPRRAHGDGVSLHGITQVVSTHLHPLRYNRKSTHRCALRHVHRTEIV